MRLFSACFACHWRIARSIMNARSAVGSSDLAAAAMRGFSYSSWRSIVSGLARMMRRIVSGSQPGGMSDHVKPR